MQDEGGTGSTVGPRRVSDSADSVPAIPLGHSETSLAVMRILGRRGIPSFIASLGRMSITHSRWYRPCPTAREGYPKPTDLARFLEGLPFERGVLMPTSDDWVQAVMTLGPDFLERFPVSLAPPETIAILLDKARLGTELERLGIPHPATYVLASPQDVDRVPDVLFQNAFLKPRESLRFFRRYQVKGIRVRDKADARARLADLEKEGHAMVLQEFLAGTAADHFFLEGFVGRRGTIAACFARQRLRMWPPDFGQSSFTVSVPSTTVAPARQSLERLFAHVPYRGIFGAEFMRDRRTGEFRLLEVNVRPYSHVEFAYLCGLDLVYMAYRDALGMPVGPVAGHEVGRRCVDLYNDVPAALDLIGKGRLGRLAWIRSCLGADGFVFAWDDPMPGVFRTREVVQRFFETRGPGPFG
jgi:D-aspartate ligase